MKGIPEERPSLLRAQSTVGPLPLIRTVCKLKTLQSPQVYVKVLQRKMSRSSTTSSDRYRSRLRRNWSRNALRSTYYAARSALFYAYTTSGRRTNKSQLYYYLTRSSSGVAWPRTSARCDYHLTSYTRLNDTPYRFDFGSGHLFCRSARVFSRRSNAPIAVAGRSSSNSQYGNS